MMTPTQPFSRVTDKPPLFPPVVSAFLRSRLVDSAGAALITLALLMVLSLLSYDPADPSANTATDALTTHNWLGFKGSYFADFMIQWFGLAAFLPPVMLAGWGLRIILRLPITHLIRRLVAGAVVTLFAAGAAAGLPVFGSWPFGMLSGGAGGVLLLGSVAASMPGAWLHFTPFWAAGLAAIVAVAMFFPVVGFSYGQWGLGGVWLFRRTRRVLRFLLGATLWVWSCVRHPHDLRPFAWRQGDDDTEEDENDEAAEPLRPLEESRTAAPRRRKGKGASRRRVVESGGESDDYVFPPLDLLALPNEKNVPRQTEAQLNATADELMGALNDYGVEGQILKASPGPVVTLYELEPAPGTKSARVIGLADDIARQMSALSVRVATVPGRNVLGIELPNQKRETVFLRELLAHASYARTNAKLPLALGKDIGGEPVVTDLARMPHLLVAGTTGSGKSVSVNTMILSLLYRLTPEQVRLIMVDPKMLELSIYEGIPHLLAPVVTDPKKAVVALKWTVREMEDRYRAMSKLGVRNIDGYNERIREARAKGEVLSRRIQTGFDADTGKPVFEDQPIDLVELPFIVVVVDEMADLMLVACKEIEAAIQRLAQMARAAGIHIIMATQRPSVDVITGTIKANFPTRISFQVTSRIDSRTILNEQGAEQLLGQGDMLYMAGGGRITRVHGAFASDHEVEEVVRHLRAQGEPVYVEAVTLDPEAGDSLPGGEGGESDELYDRAVQIVLRERKASTSYIQRCLQIGYNRAARLVERMEAEGVVSPANHVGKREILVPGESAR